jgi:hypothetical protein
VPPVKRKHGNISDPSALQIVHKSHLDDEPTAEICGDFPQVLSHALLQNGTLAKSGNINGDGWAHVHVGSNLYLWKFTEKYNVHVHQEVYTYPLPPIEEDEGSSRHYLISVWECSSHQFASKPPSLMVVTPQGLVNFWADIRSQDRPPSQLDLELADGEECTMLLSLQPEGFLVGTSTGVIHQIKFFEHQWELRFKTWQATSGIITDTMKMLGLGGKQTSNDSILTMVLQSSLEEVFVLTESALQCWSMSGDHESLKYSFPLLQTLQTKEATSEVSPATFLMWSVKSFLYTFTGIYLWKVCV